MILFVARGVIFIAFVIHKINVIVKYLSHCKKLFANNSLNMILSILVISHLCHLLLCAMDL
jgi:hypothetical protein